MKFPKNFSYVEMVRSDTAQRMNWDNTPNRQQRQNLIKTARFLQELRDKLSESRGKDTPIRVTSGFRSEVLNKAISGAPKSAHMDGLAADIVVVGMSAEELARFISENMENYDTVIHEFGRWVHVNLSSGNPRGRLLTAHRDPVRGGVQYVRGIHSVDNGRLVV